MIRRVFALLIALYGVGFGIWAMTLPSAADPGLRTDAIVVPTGGPGRIERGASLLSAGAAKRMLISGVDRQVRAHELTQSHQVDPRLLACCIDLGREAVDTRSNAEEIARWIAQRRVRSVRLVTSDWHMRRAHHELRLAIPADVGVVDDAVRSHPRLATLFGEYNKMLLRLVAGVAL